MSSCHTAPFLILPDDLVNSSEKVGQFAVWSEHQIILPGRAILRVASNINQNTAVEAAREAAWGHSYVDFAHLADLAMREVFWVTRAKDNLEYRVVESDGPPGEGVKLNGVLEKNGALPWYNRTACRTAERLWLAVSLWDGIAALSTSSDGVCFCVLGYLPAPLTPVRAGLLAKNGSGSRASSATADFTAFEIRRTESRAWPVHACDKNGSGAGP